MIIAHCFSFIYIVTLPLPYSSGSTLIFIHLSMNEAVFFNLHCIIDLMTNNPMCISQFGCDNYGDHTHFAQVSHGYWKGFITPSLII